MTLLQQIRTEAVDSGGDLSALLRKCMVLAARLRHPGFSEWVRSELNGYPDRESLPAYREFDSEAYGDFGGPFQSAIKNAPIPAVCVPEDLRELAFRETYLEGVSTLADIVSRADEQTLRRPWPADLIALMQRRPIYKGYVLASAWRLVSVANLVGILDTIRNRILSFALEIEAEAPDAGEAQPDGTALSPETVAQVFNTFVMGDLSNLAVGSGSTEQTSVTVVSEGDWENLQKHLSAMGIQPTDIEALKEALEEEPTIRSKSSFGAKVSTWLGKMVSKSAQGVWKVGTSVASQVLTKALLGYYGLTR